MKRDIAGFMRNWLNTFIGVLNLVGRAQPVY